MDRSSTPALEKWWVSTARFSNSGNFYLSGGEDGIVYIWESSHAGLLSSIDSHAAQIRDICASKDESKCFSCHADGRILYYDISRGHLLRYFEGRKDGVNAVKVNEFGTVIVSADSCVRLWDCRSHSNEPIQIFDTFKADVTSLCLSGRTEIIAGSLDGSIQKFDLRNNSHLTYDLGSPVTCTSMGNTGTCIIASRLDSTFQLLHVNTKSVRKGGTYHGHTCELSKVGCCFTKDTTHVVGGSEDGRIFMWDLVGKHVVSEFVAHSGAVTSVDYHPTEDWMVSASVDGSVVLWKDAI